MTLSPNNSISYKTNSSNDLHLILEEKIFTIFFNISRIDSSNISHKSDIIFDFLYVSSNYKTKFPLVFNYFLDLYKKIILYTRDIYFGLAERSYSYLLITCMHSVFPEYTFLILKTLFFPQFSHNRNFLPIGSWCDLKFLSIFILSHPILSPSLQKSFFKHIVHFVNLQLFSDLSNIQSSHSFIHPRYVLSNVSKWIPREKNNSILYDLFSELAFHWSQFYDSSPGHVFKKYRTVVSSINSIILTYETHHNISAPSTIKHQFRNLISSNPPISTPSSIFASSSTPINPGFFVSNMFSAIRLNQTKRISFLDFKWNSFIYSNSIKPLLDFIPIIDMTLFHSNPSSFYNMLGIAIFISFNSSFQYKIIIASQSPSCIDLSDFTSLHSIILHFLSIIHDSNSIFSFSLDSALNLFQNSILSTTPPSPSFKPNLLIFASRPSNFLHNTTLFNKSLFSFSFWNISNHTFDSQFIQSIQPDFFLFNGLNINSIRFSSSNLLSHNLFVSSNVFKYFNFLFNNPRYLIDN